MEFRTGAWAAIGVVPGARQARCLTPCSGSRPPGEFLHPHVDCNGKRIGLSGTMLEGNWNAIPTVPFQIQLMVEGATTMASWLHSDCRPAGRILDLEVDGQRASFNEHVL